MSETQDWATRHDSRFVTAVRKVLKHEGFFSDDPDDPGGATKYGVSLRWLRSKGDWGDFDGDGDVDRDDIWAMEESEAVDAYHRFWWVAQGYGEFQLSVGAKIFDLAINMGPKPAHRILQRAVRGAEGAALVDDGAIGPATRAAIAKVDPEYLSVAIRSEAAGHYRLLIARKPVFEKYRRGWLNRAYA